MICPRVIPCLLIRGTGLVKTLGFKDPKYVGDPRNAVKIFNEKEVDELIILDILATPESHGLQFDLMKEIVSEAFMPVAYGGGIRSLEDARKMFTCGVEKIVISTHSIENPSFVSEAAKIFGSQSIVVCLDIKKDFFGRYEVYKMGGRIRTNLNPINFALQMEEMGVGEIMVNSMDKDGTMSGYDLELIKVISGVVNVPLIACGGAGKIEDLGEAVRKGGASAVAAGSLFVFHGKHRSVLISYPEQAALRKVLS